MTFTLLDALLVGAAVGLLIWLALYALHGFLWVTCLRESKRRNGML